MKKILASLVAALNFLAGKQVAYATYTYEIGGPLGEAYGSVHDVFVLERAIDFSLVIADRAAASLVALGNADILKLISIPATAVNPVLVMSVTMNVEKAMGAAFTGSVGDSGSAIQYLNASNMNAVAGYASGAAAWKMYTAADDLVLTLNNAMPASPNNVAQICVKMILMRLDRVTASTQMR